MKLLIVIYDLAPSLLLPSILESFILHGQRDTGTKNTQGLNTSVI